MSITEQHAREQYIQKRHDLQGQIQYCQQKINSGTLQPWEVKEHDTVVRSAGQELRQVTKHLTNTLFSSPYCCDNCDHIDEVEAFPDAKDLSMRLTPGGTYTDRECPECGALAYPLTTDEAADAGQEGAA